MMEAEGFSEMSFSIYQTTRRNIPEDIHLHNRRRENLKSREVCSELLEHIIGLCRLATRVLLEIALDGNNGDCLLIFETARTVK
jgi:hypothetical protein